MRMATEGKLGKLVHILLVEDNLVDVMVTKEAFGEGKVANQISVVNDGVEAMAFLRREGEYANAPRPHLILLDLNLPRKDGRELLAEIKQDPNLKRIPVIVLTTSQDEHDICKSYELHANCFVTKPVTLNEFVSVVKEIEGFWFQLVKLPPDGDKLWIPKK
ncbi:MAG: response regulator [Desulfomonile tiedjei]|nr:response regulator [Desulfomonile tiedjei]